MATPKRKNQTSYKKGKKPTGGAPKQRSSYDREALLAKKIDNVVITNYLTLNSHLSEEQLQKRLKEPNLSSLEKALIKNLIFAADGADIQRLTFVLDRLVGKPKQEIELSKKDPLKDLSPEQLLEMKRELEKSNRQSMDLLEKTNPRVQQQLKQYDEQLREITNTDSTEPSKTD